MKQKKRTKLDLPACHEVQIHYKRPLFNKNKKITSSEDAEKILREFVDANRIDHKEFFWVILLTNANQVIGISEIGVGTTKGVMVNTKEICQLALLTNTVGILVAHNHPSGKLIPSESDLRMTENFKKIFKLLDINLLDHIIISSEGYYSFTDNNDLP